MVPHLAADARPTMLSACLANVRSHTTRCIPKGRRILSIQYFQWLTHDSYVEMLENQQAQLVAGLQELYRRLRADEGWTGPVLRETSQGLPLTHEILENLGVLKQDNLPSSESFEEDLHALQRKLFANGAGFMKQEVSFDNHSDSDHSPMFEPAVTQRTSHFTNPWISNHFPPTPPTGSPRPSLVKASSPLKAQIPMSKPQYSADPSWEADSAELPESMELNITYESPMDFTCQAMLNPGQLYLDPTQLSIQPSLTMKDDWYRQEDQTQRYFHRGIFT